MLQTIVIAVSLALTVVTVYLVATAVRSMVGVLRIGQPASRADAPGKRTLTMLKETFGHTRMFQWRWVGVMHWFVYFGFLILAFAVLTGMVQLFKPSWQIWWVGHWFVYEWVQEAIGVLSTIGIIFLIVYRQFHKPQQLGRRSRFFGSTFWQAYFVEYMALLEGVAILFIRGAERKLEILDGHRDRAGAFHYPIAHLFSGLYGDGEQAIKNAIWVIAFVKVASALVWLDVVATNLTMGIAWHRFTAWFNIWFKRESSGRTALGAIKPLTSDGKTITLDDIDELDEDSKLGVGAIEDFSWKGILDFTTCTECGRCQSQCPAWNTEKPLSPKHLVMSLREHAYAAAPYLQSGQTDGTVAEKPLIGHTDAEAATGAGEEVLDWFYNPADGGFVIDEDVLWSCTSCGACVQQCPVDIEHVDHIMDMRRYQVLVESNFPTELNGLFKGLENKGNPWNMSPNARMDWAKDLPFDVKVVGEDIESLESVDWLFWVGCAGAYEDRAKKTTRAVAELLDLAGISFGVLGNGETCTGDPARRAGNEFVFQGLAQQNVETFKEFKVKSAVTTCAHCFNTLKNEYKEFGIELEVVHHTQLLNRLVRDGRLTPVKDGAGAHKRSITYHDPCYIGRHNGVYTPPRELLQVLPGAEYVEMPRNSERSFCCGAGGARMWMEEKLGSRINRNRTDEAVATGADQIAVGCPFCRVMLSDGLTAAQADGTAREEVEVLDVAQMLLASVKDEMATKLAPGAGAATAAKVATAAEPSAGDVTDTGSTLAATEDVGPAAKATQESGGGSSLFDTPAQESATTPDDASSLFDTPAPAEPEAESPAQSPAAPSTGGGSLFDEGGSLFDTPAEEPSIQESSTTTPGQAEVAPGQAEAAPGQAEAASEPSSGLGGGSLFDIPAESAASETAAAEDRGPTAEESVEPTAAGPDLGAGGSLFDVPAETAATEISAEDGPATEEATQPPSAEEPTAAEPGLGAGPELDAGPDLGAGGSLFDIPAAPAAEAAGPVAPEEVAEPADEPATDAGTTETAATEAAGPAEAVAPASDSGKAASQPRNDVDIEGTSSLFDIEAPEDAVDPAASDTAARSSTPSAGEEATHSVAEPVADAPAAGEAPDPGAQATESAEPSVADAPAAGGAPDPGAQATESAETSVADAPAAREAPSPGAQATQSAETSVADAPAASEDGQRTAEDTPEEEPEQPEERPVTDAGPVAGSGEAHKPRTDVEINDAGSLFDL